MEFLAGLGLGIAIGACVLAWYVQKSFRLADRERKLLLNKSFVRDAQGKLFAEAIINEGLPEVAPAPLKPPIRLITPFARGLQKARERLQSKPQVDAGQKLPDEIKEQIREAAEKQKEAA